MYPHSLLGRERQRETQRERGVRERERGGWREGERGGVKQRERERERDFIASDKVHDNVVERSS